MKTFRPSSLWVAIVVSGSACAAGAPSFKVKVVAPPPSYASVYPLKINDSGSFAGRADLADGSSSYVLWTKKSGYTFIEAPNGAAIVGLAGFNSSGVVVGSTDQGGFIWRSGSGAETIEPPAGYIAAYPQGINDSNEVVGLLRLSGDSATASFTWHPGSITKALVPNRNSAANAVNDVGNIAATLFKETKSEALFVRAGHVVPIGFGTFNGGTQAVAINDSGTVLLNQLFILSRAAIWSQEDGVLVLPPVESTAIAIAENGQVMAEVGDDAGDIPGTIIWRQDYGVVYLKDTLPPRAKSIVNFFGLDMSHHGLIAATGEENGIIQAILMIPDEQDSAD